LNTTTRKIGVILLFIILLPAVIFSIYEISTLNESEKMIDKIYNNQLDALLFSVNQYSEDVAGRFQYKLNLINEQDDSLSADKQLNNFIEENSHVKKIVFSDSIFASSDQTISDMLKVNRQKVERLYSFKKEKYNRIEPIEYNNNTFLFFVLDNPKMQNLCGIMIDSDRFIRDILSPKILSIAQNEFSIYVFNKEIIYDFNSDGNVNPHLFSQQRKLWLLPSFSLAIKLKGETIEDLVSQRAETNLILILALTLILLAGVWFVFRNIKREVELAQVKSEFVSNVSHELRTPLSLISMFAETLEMGRVKSEEKKKEYYSIISQEALRLSKIVNKILSFSKMEAGKRTYRFEEIDLNEVAGQVYDSYKFHLQNNGFEFTFDKYNSYLKIKADAEAVAEAIINLVDNAVKYSKDRKVVKIITGFEQEFVFIEVKDLGIGIEKEDQERIFEKFYRVKSGLVHNTKGTGLGLSLVKQIMDSHKGEISLSSELGKGSALRLKFKKSV
jgi:two-component system, OmpR family, phosphate regulon sensor histidine kinase PhoR